MDLETTSKSLTKENRQLKTQILRVEEELALLQKFVQHHNQNVVNKDEVYDRINGNEIQDYIKMEKIKEVKSMITTINDDDDKERIYNLTVQQHLNMDTIDNLTRQMSNFDKLHMSMLELLENVESLEYKVDTNFPEFRKEISKLEIQCAESTSRISLLNEDQTNTRNSVKAIGVSVSTMQDKTDIDRVNVERITKQLENLMTSSNIQTSKLHDHILKVST